MTDSEIRLKCLDLAMSQARAENLHADIDRVVEISTRFYNHIVQAPATEVAAPERPGRGRPRKDKDIFG